MNSDDEKRETAAELIRLGRSDDEVEGATGLDLEAIIGLRGAAASRPAPRMIVS